MSVVVPMLTLAETTGTLSSIYHPTRNHNIPLAPSLELRTALNPTADLTSSLFNIAMFA